MGSFGKVNEANHRADTAFKHIHRIARSGIELIQKTELDTKAAISCTTVHAKPLRLSELTQANHEIQAEQKPAASTVHPMHFDKHMNSVEIQRLKCGSVVYPNDNLAA